jgi:hypothetical protein
VQVGGKSSGPCVAFDRRRYTLPTIKRGLEVANMRKRLALFTATTLTVREGGDAFYFVLASDA